MNPLAFLSGGGTGGGFSASAASSLDSKNQISSGARNVGGINIAPKESNLLMVGLIGAVVLAGFFLVKKAK
jgi:hypothetical protein